MLVPFTEMSKTGTEAGLGGWSWAFSIVPHPGMGQRTVLVFASRHTALFFYLSQICVFPLALLVALVVSGDSSQTSPRFRSFFFSD